ncbi:MAG TPA: hypothetical protein VFM88_04850, partial [Vicinamibacteria bacterium]|nr:hypothetical protein [Vicinamibacteria bacterium]
RARERDRRCGAGVALALACLTRPEGALVFAASAAGRLVGGAWRSPDERRRLVLDAMVVAGVVAGHVAFRLWAYGDFLPNTFHAKAGGYWQRPREYLGGFAWQHLTPVLAPLPLLALLDRRATLRAAFLPALAVLAGGVLAIYAAGTDWMPGYRLLCPYLPAWTALAGFGIALLCARVAGRAAPALAGLAMAAAAAGSSAWQAPVLGASLEDVAAYNVANRRGHEALAAWVAAHARTGQSIALMDIGVIGVRLMNLTVVDISGLTDRHIGRLPGGFLTKQPDADYVLGRRPDFVVLSFAVPAGRPERARSWTAMERAILEHPEFRRAYARPRTCRAGASQLERFACLYGAAQAFDATPRSYRYYQAVFERDRE